MNTRGRWRPTGSTLLVAVICSGWLQISLLPAQDTRPEAQKAKVIWRMPLDCTSPGWPDHWWAYDQSGAEHQALKRRAKRTGETVPDYTPPENLCPLWFEVEDDRRAPGGKALRISGPVKVTTWSAPGQPEGTPVLFSAYLKGQRNGVEATLYTDRGTKTVRLSKKWQRYSITVPHPVTRRWTWFNWGFVGNKEGVFHAAGIQMELPVPGPEKRAAHWSRSFKQDYELAESAAHTGKRGIRLRPSQLRDTPNQTEQTLEIKEPLTGPLRIRGWCRREPIGEGVRSAPPYIRVELYGPEREFKMTPELEAIELPHRKQAAIRKAKAALKTPFRAATVAFTAATGEWQELEQTLDPAQPLRARRGKKAEEIPAPPLVKIRVLVVNQAVTPVCFDDLVLRTAPVKADSGAIVRPAGQNLLKNGDFEVPEAVMVVSRQSQPSPYGEPIRSSYSEHYPRPPEATCPLTGSKPAIDGALDDACWQSAQLFDSFVEIAKGAPANPAIRAKVCRDANTLYVAYEWDFSKDEFNDPSRARPREEGERQPDGPIAGVLLKPELLHPGRQFFDFAVTPDGTKRNGKGYEHRFGTEALKFFLGGWENQSWGFYEDEWNKPWEAKVTGDQSSWTAEIAIPVTSLEVDLNSDFWGLNLWAKTASGKTFAWSPPYQMKLPGQYYAPLWDHHVCRTKGTNHYYGILRGMKGLVASRPYEHMLRVIYTGLEAQPGGTTAALAQLQRNIPLPEDILEARAEVTIVDVEEALKKVNRKLEAGEDAAVDKDRAHQIALEMDMQRILFGIFHGIWGHGETRTTKVKFSGPEAVIRVGGFAAKWQEGKRYRVRVTLKTLDGKVDLARKDRTVTIDPRYNCLLASARIRTQYSLYVEDQTAKVFVESSLAEKSRVAFYIPDPDGKRRATKVIGEDTIEPGERRYLEIDLADVSMGLNELHAAFVNERGDQVAASSDEIHRRPPSPYGFTRINRVTGCLVVEGKSVILRTGVRAPGRNWGGGGPDFFAPPRYGYNGAMGFPPEPPAEVKHHYIPWLHNHQLNDEVVARLVGKIRETKANPNIVAWKLVDEPYGGPDICRRYWELAREEDPYRPHYQVSGPIDTEVKVAGGYCFGLGRKWSTPWNYSLEFNAMKFHHAGKIAREKGMPIHSWYSFIQGGCSLGRMPSPDEIRCQIYHGVIYGVRNFMYWVGRSPHQLMLERLGEVHAELEVFQNFLDGKNVMPVLMDRRDGVHLALWKSEEGLCLLAANSTPFSASTTLDVDRLAGSVKRMRVRFGNRRCAKLRDGKLTIRFGALERAMVFMQ